MESGPELLRKGYILTSELCPKCKKPLFKNPKTGTLLCVNCKYKKLSEREILKNLYEKILEKIGNVEPENSYKLLKSLYLLKKLLK